MGLPNGHIPQCLDDELMQLTLQIRNRKDVDKKYAQFRGDQLLADAIIPKVGFLGDIQALLSRKNWPTFGNLFENLLSGKVSILDLASLASSLSDNSTLRNWFIDLGVKAKYDQMLHPPLTYLGDAFRYRAVDGKFNSVVNPHIGQAGAPYAKTVPSKSAPLGALPDPGDLFDKLMARGEAGRQSESGLSSMLIYHATIIIHDIFRTNDNDKNISDSSSYLDLSPLYGYTMEMQRKIRDDKYKLGHLKPDTFAEDRLLRQPPGVCIMLVMYNRYHNYAAKMLYRINENGRFSIPAKFANSQLVSLVQAFYPREKQSGQEFFKQCHAYDVALKAYEAADPGPDAGVKFDGSNEARRLRECEKALLSLLDECKASEDSINDFKGLYDAAWNKLDDDLFNTARLITCGMYIQIAVHDYLRALMGFHQFDTNLTLDPRDDFDQKMTTRGLGNQVTVEFNLLYRFHCAISLKDEQYTEEYMEKMLNIKDPSNTSLQEFLTAMATVAEEAKAKAAAGQLPPEPSQVTFGIAGDPSQYFARNKITNLFDDQQMVDALTSAMDEPISNFGPRNVPKCLKAVEIMGIVQARKWEIGTLNDFREFFNLPRHETFGSVTKNPEVQNALRDLYENPDKVELYPGIFCESDEVMGLDPSPTQASSALWTAIFCDAITLVRSDRFYTVDWNTNSLTSWGMKEVTSDNEILKSSVFHRLIQRAFPGWFPYNSIRFFHPFYTAQQNAAYAVAQGYGPDFKMTQTPILNEATNKLEYDVSASQPSKPEKPVYFTDFASIDFVLTDRNGDFVHPSLLRKENLPRKMQDVLDSAFERPTFGGLDDYMLQAESRLKSYLVELMQSIVRREAIAMTNSTFQIDVTRDFAIPVVTRYVVDFLGFGNLMRTESNPSGTYSENEIYQHITNCQTFLSISVDDTKLLKRRKAFRESMGLLMKLTQGGNIARASSMLSGWFDAPNDNSMVQLGYFVSQKILAYSRDSQKAAAILLLVCLDFAYNSVNSFTAVVYRLMDELYTAANSPPDECHNTPKWVQLQDLALSEADGTQQRLDALVQDTARAAVHLPILRVATEIVKVGTHQIKAGQTVILDMHIATATALKANKAAKIGSLSYQSSFGSKFDPFVPKRFAVLALSTMTTFIARMKNARRGHDAQGKLKRIDLDYTAEGYSNFMAPERMDWIARQVSNLPSTDPDKTVFTPQVLRPGTNTYLTPLWDEMVPFPMTWKVRFDGFGASDYSTQGHPYGALRTAWVPDDMAPWYQPQGPSHTGGTFGDVVCVCVGKESSVALPGRPKVAPTLTSGCGLGCGGVHGAQGWTAK
ncbi:hypothetical protein LTR62_006051 [Meristemomyces frigidus]|uniref:Linoleate diol synthase n=1 Tax=Meristemomyces frigidus TaxID=1508187 RepID=A0AAN7TGH8_9PEZI|nr:hypothetical protein LTR62_006051 [Meristemomyces frigidus]